MTLRTRLTVAFVLVVLVPLLVGSLLVVRAFPEASTARQAETATASSRLVATVLASDCGRVRAAAEAAGRAAVGIPRGSALTALTALVRDHVVDGVQVIGTTGVLAAAGRVPDLAHAGDCSGGGAPPAPYLSAVLPLRTAAGAPAGTAVASLSVDAGLASRLRDAVGLGQVALLSGSRVVATSGALPADLVAAAAASPQAPVARAGWVAALSPARPGQPYAVLVAVPQARSDSLLLLAASVVAGAVLLAVAIALLLARATTRPLEELGEAAARIAAGDLDTPIRIRSRDEVGRLATAFNEMTEELRTYVGALEASRDELQSSLSRLGETLSSTHDLDRILTVVLETAMAATRAQAGMVLLFTATRDELVLATGRGLARHGVPSDLRVPVGMGVSGRVAESGEALSGRLGTGPDQLRPGAGEPVAGSVIAVPLKSSGTVIGVLDLFDRVDAADFDDHDLTTIHTFASQATVAVDNVLLHEEAQRLSITDGLTGLWNYRYFTMTMAKEIERAARFGRPLALLMLDLDHFKAINDRFGHQRGDAVLVELAGRVRAQVRDVDTVARYGGEEIVVVLPETDEAGAAHAAERICSAVRRRPFGDHAAPGVEVTVSVGAAVFPQHGTTAAVLLRRADEALYAAKDAGRDTWRLAAAAEH